MPDFQSLRFDHIGLNGAHSQAVATSAEQPLLAIVNAAAVVELVPIADAIELIDTAMRELSADRVVAPKRWTVPVSPNGTMGLMPGSMPGLDRFGIKVLSLFDNGMETGRSGHQGLMLLFDRTDGRPLAVIESGALTALRTAAASAVATRALARQDARSVAIIGCGEQANWHVDAMTSVRPIEQIRVWARSPEKAQRFANRHRQRGQPVIVARSARAAVTGADIICMVSHSPEPLVFGDWLEDGQHLNLVGASVVSAREVDDIAVARGRFFVDSRSHALVQAGELLHAVAAGVVGKEHVIAEIGEVLDGHVVGRSSPSSITIYKSLGHVVQDLCVADAIFARLARSDHVQKARWQAVG